MYFGKSLSIIGYSCNLNGALLKDSATRHAIMKLTADSVWYLVKIGFVKTHPILVQT